MTTEAGLGASAEPGFAWECMDVARRVTALFQTPGAASGIARANVWAAASVESSTCGLAPRAGARVETLCVDGDGYRLSVHCEKGEASCATRGDESPILVGAVIAYLLVSQFRVARAQEGWKPWNLVVVRQTVKVVTSGEPEAGATDLIIEGSGVFVDGGLAEIWVDDEDDVSALHVFRTIGRALCHIGKSQNPLLVGALIPILLTIDLIVHAVGWVFKERVGECRSIPGGQLDWTQLGQTSLSALAWPKSRSIRTEAAGQGEEKCLEKEQR